MLIIGLRALSRHGTIMHTIETGKELFLIDLETGGLKNLIASYVPKGTRTTIMETGPSSSILNLLSGFSKSHPIYAKTVLENNVQVLSISQKRPNLIRVQNCFIFSL